MILIQHVLQFIDPHIRIDITAHFDVNLKVFNIQNTVFLNGVKI
jgi:hypothetical protein